MQLFSPTWIDFINIQQRPVISDIRQQTSNVKRDVTQVSAIVCVEVLLFHITIYFLSFLLIRLITALMMPVNR